jgi:hypothetical protein
MSFYPFSSRGPFLDRGTPLASESYAENVAMTQEHSLSMFQPINIIWRKLATHHPLA